ncbi:hypothetical protein GCM10023149_25800 [Mucilaginibacter gynuensis]|uniref:DUF1735 domain-containing protein n=1 Tax=Mucilaginibacter gynuensis TaxID=1302236 RepID=A0ABP8GHN9_9SPHI
MKKKIYLLVMSAGLLGLTSCLKDKNVNLDADKSPATLQWSTILDVPAGTGGGYTLYARAYDIQDASHTTSFDVNYTGGDPAPSDITVEIGLDAKALDAYNVDHDSKLAPLATNLYTMPSSVVIKKGDRKATVNMTVKVDKNFDLSQGYAIPLAIKSTTLGNISANYGTIIFGVNAKNEYDGIYLAKGYILRAGDNVLSGNFKDIRRSLSTTGVNSVTFPQNWADGSNVGGIDGLTITVNKATNKVTMSSVNPALTNLPSYDNRYDPATKTFYLSFYWGTGPGNRAATDTLVYSGPR